MDKTFSKTDSSIVKGVGVLLFCLHHLYWKKVMTPVDIGLSNADQLVVAWTKMALSLFVILSGYGLTKSFNKNTSGSRDFVIKHIKKLLINFWWVYIPVLILSFFFHIWGTPIEIYGGINPVGLRNFLLEVFGMRALFYTPTLNQSWWYFEAIIVLYLVFPVLYKGVYKFPILTLTLSALPPALVGFGLYWNETFQTEREVFWFLPFVAGMLFARFDTLDEVKKSVLMHKWIWIPVLGVLLAAIMFIRTRMLLLPDTPYAFFVIIGCIWLGAYFPRFVSSFLDLLGRHSMTIFMVHSFLYYYFGISAKALKLFPDRYGIRYAVFVLYSLAVAVVFDKIKDALIKWWKGRSHDRAV